jgi:NAD(P)H-dependent flavin oxidoreductase YrpB (nitropropane dioxygenase family)
MTPPTEVLDAPAATEAASSPGPASAQAQRQLPVVIQGGMGVAVSSWPLARAVAQHGGLGVVSGTALDVVIARRLQDGDVGGHIRRAAGHFPLPGVADRVIDRYLRPDGRAGRPYRPVPRLRLDPRPADVELAVFANFAEVWLARQGHDGLVGINFLEKVQLATPAAAYGAMLAGVDFVLMGAGIPTEIPVLLDGLAVHRPVRLSVHVDNASREHEVRFDPAVLVGADALPALVRPQFLAIVSAHVLASYLARDAATRPDGFVIEAPAAGGHNAPPRGKLALDSNGEPIYGRRDVPDLDQIAALGLPFWLAGSRGTPEQVADALATGATGVQVGTLFALSAESGFTDELRRGLLDRLHGDALHVRTDPLASPTGFPFKVTDLPATLSDADRYETRPRLCDLGYLRVPFEHADGSVGYRCPGEPMQAFVRKGGDPDEAMGRKCLCNGLTANVGLAQVRLDGYTEVPLVTLGADLGGARRLLADHPGGWTAAQAVDWLQSSVRRAR